MSKRSRLFLLGVPLLMLIAVAPFTPWLDIQITNFFYSSQNGTPFVDNVVTSSIFKYGTWPALILLWGAVVIYIARFFFTSLKKWKKIALYYILNMVIGVELIINLTLKAYWGRPRPIHIHLFGGDQQFLPFYQSNIIKGLQNTFHSFPSGHSAMGFIFFSVIFIGFRLKSKALFGGGVALTVFLGVSLSLTRIAQGGHFFSDTLFAAFIMWYVALVLDYFIFENKTKLKT